MRVLRHTAEHSAFFGCCLFEAHPPFESSLAVYGLTFASLVCGGLGLAPPFHQVAERTKSKLDRSQSEKDLANAVAKKQQEFVDYIQYMNPRERAIYGYLLEHNQKSFEAEMDCGPGSSLLKRGFIQMDAIYGMSYSMQEFPFSVPDHIWDKLLEHRATCPEKHEDPGLPWFRRRL